MDVQDIYKLISQALHNADDSRTALDVSRFSTGQFNGYATKGAGVEFPQDQIELLNYGNGDRLPSSSGFRTLVPQMNATDAHTNLYQGGLLVDSHRPAHFLLIGLGARIGRPRLLDEYSGQHEYAHWIDKCQLAIREAIAESTSVVLFIKDGMYRYSLGSLVARPLMGSIYGPNAGLLDDVVEEKERLDLAFVPFRVPAMSIPNQRTTATLTRSERISMTSDGTWPDKNGHVVVPISIWVFGYPYEIPDLSCGR